MWRPCTLEVSVLHMELRHARLVPVLSYLAPRVLAVLRTLGLTPVPPLPLAGPSVGDVGPSAL